MSDMGLFATQLENATEQAENFDKALSTLKRAEENKSSGDNLKEEKLARETVQRYFQSLMDMINGKLGPTTRCFRTGVLGTLKKVHHTDWQKYTKELKLMSQRIKDIDWSLEEKHYRYLEEFANALEAECSVIFQRMRGRSI